MKTKDVYVYLVRDCSVIVMSDTDRKRLVAERKHDTEYLKLACSPIVEVAVPLPEVKP